MCSLLDFSLRSPVFCSFPLLVDGTTFDVDDSKGELLVANDVKSCVIDEDDVEGAVLADDDDVVDAAVVGAVDDT